MKIPAKAKKIEIKVVNQDIITKNTNPVHYNLDAESIDVKQELKNFISGFDKESKKQMQMKTPVQTKPIM